MKEFIEKLIERLEEISAENTCSDCPYKLRCDEVQKQVNDETTDLCGATIKSLAISIVNQLVEEHKDNVMIDGQYCWQTCGSTEHCKECNRLCNGSIDYYENYDFMAEEYKVGWIPCSERLPKPIDDMLQCVIVTNKNDWQGMAYYHPQKGWIFAECNNSDRKIDWTEIVAWRPLPAPYKEGE